MSCFIRLRECAPILLLGVTLLACASSSDASGTLHRAVNSYNELMRWKKFEQAAGYIPANKRADFLERYLAVEDDLFVESMEVRGITWVTTEDNPVVDVNVIANAYLLPSTVLEKVVMRQRWEFRNGAWNLANNSREIVPKTTKPAENQDADAASTEDKYEF
ncbi:MAG: hypothetical protein R3C68_15370 [Myxococcota bacterium]